MYTIMVRSDSSILEKNAKSTNYICSKTKLADGSPNTQSLQYSWKTQILITYAQVKIEGK